MKNFLKYIIIIMICAVAAPAPAAHDKKDDSRKQRRETWARSQANTIAEKLNLSDEQTTRFVDIYLQCQKEMWKLGRAPKGIHEDVKSEQKATEILKEMFTKRRAINAIQEKYYKQYSKFLTQVQILKMYEIERRLMEKHHNHHKGSSSPKPGK